MSGPTAKPFNALGRGNGFPFCIDHQTQPNPDIHSGPYTYAEAMALFWNVSTLHLTATGGGFSYNETLPYGFLGAFGEIGEPFTRVCINAMALFGTDAGIDAVILGNDGIYLNFAEVIISEESPTGIDFIIKSGTNRPEVNYLTRGIVFTDSLGVDWTADIFPTSDKSASMTFNFYQYP